MKEIAALIGILIFCEFFYVILFLLVDYREKGNHKKTYKIGFSKFIMIKYTKQIESTWKEEQEFRKKGQKHRKDPTNISTISRLSFWLQVIHLIYLFAFIAISILYAILQTDALTLAAKTMGIIFFALIPLSYITYFIRMAVIEKGKGK